MKRTVIVAGKQADERILTAEALRIVWPDARIVEVFDASRFVELIEAEKAPALVIIDDQNCLSALRTIYDAKYPAARVPIMILTSDNIDNGPVLSSYAIAVFAMPATLEGFLSTARLITNQLLTL